MFSRRYFSTFQILKSLNTFSIRGSHTDIKVPDFSRNMRNSVADPNCRTHQTEESRKLFSYMMSGVLLTSGMYAVKSEVHRFVKFMDASADVLALAQIEVDLSQISEDRHMTFKWRGKPLFVWNRPDEAIKTVRQVPLNILRDPQRDEDRVKEDKWFICIGVCTHLGCVPLSHQGDFGGYYCPCHGSHFDISGRARKGPAPSNLVVPPYTISGTNLTVG